MDNTKPMTITSTGKRMIYIVGAPATGKSTLMSHLRSPYQVNPVKEPFAHLQLCNADGDVVGVELGAIKPTFSGTDALGMQVITKAVPFIEKAEYNLVLAEGQRLANKRFITAAAVNYTVHMIHLVAPAELLDRRCIQRGSDQRPSWRKGAQSQAANIFRWCQGQAGIDTIELDSSRPPVVLLASLMKKINTHVQRVSAGEQNTG